MRIRSGFVSNSSSTSFLIVSSGEMTREKFFELVGVREESPMGEIFSELYDAIVDTSWEMIDFGRERTLDADGAVERWGTARISERMMERIRSAHESGQVVIYGMLSSDSAPVESFFCCESFEIKGDGLYLDALEAAW